MDEFKNSLNISFVGSFVEITMSNRFAVRRNNNLCRKACVKLFIL